MSVESIPWACIRAWCCVMNAKLHFRDILLTIKAPIPSTLSAGWTVQGLG